MQGTKIVELLGLLAPEEQNSFRHYYQNYYPKANRTAIKLLGVLLEHIDSPQADWDKRSIFARAFPKRSYQDALLRKQCSLLYAAVRDFLVQRHTQTGSANYDATYLQILSERSADHLFQLDIKQARLQHQQQAQRDIAHLRHGFLLAEVADHRFGRQQTRTYHGALQEKSDLLDAYFLAQKLKMSCEMVNRNQIVDANYTPHFLPEVLNMLAHRPELLRHPPIAVYRQILRTITTPEQEEYYEELIHLLSTHHHQFSATEAADLYRYAQNYCIRKINTGHQTYLQRLFELYQEQLAAKTNMPAGYLPASDYKNIATLGLQLGQTQWIKQFLHEYRPYLVASQRENVFNYNLAAFYYATQAYDQAVQLLNTVEFSDPYYEVNGKIMLLKIYLADENYFSFYYLLDAYKIKLKRNQQVGAAYRQSITNFLTQCRALAQLREHQDLWPKERFVKKHQRLQEKLHHQNNIFDRRWLKQELALLSVA